MTDSKRKFYLTTPIYYANSRPHVGSAYTTIVCDVIARYKRMCGYDVAFVTGTDEHGVNIERAAEAQGITPQQLVDKNQQLFRNLWKLLGIDFRDGHFVRTTEPRHERAVQNLVRRTIERDKARPVEKRAIYKAKYEGRYCIYDNLYVSDTPEPVNCQICGRPAELISEENYFFRLKAYEDRLLEFYDANPKWVEPDFRFNEVKAFVRAGLKDVSISRKTIKWGIPWPDDPEHVFYVWYDALTSYMTAIGFVDGEHDSQEFKDFWLSKDAYVLHMIGKEIIRFHAVYWPAFLMAAELPLPKKIFAHGWLLFEQEKMSKSKGNVAYPEPIVNAFNEIAGAKVGNDALRYYLLRETVFGQDGNFSRDALITRYNADLANGLGNLASRTLTMFASYFDPRAVDDFTLKTLPAADLEVFCSEGIRRVRYAFDHFEFSWGLEVIWELISGVDRFLTHKRPWDLAKDVDKQEAVCAILYAAAASLRCICALAHPIIPDATQKIWCQLGETGDLSAFRLENLKWDEMSSEPTITKPSAVFPRVDKKEAMEKIEAMENEIRKPSAAQSAVAGASATATSAPAAASQQAPAASTDGKITIDDLAKIDLRVGVIKSAERIPNADKLLKLQVDIGEEVRQILAGIALAYAPEELVGRKIVVVANLAPRKMRGLESNGMLLAASVADGKPVLCTFAEDIAPGAKIK